MKNQDKYDKLIASNLNEDIKDFIATSHSNVMNNYEIVGNDKLQNVLDEMNFNYF
jgi:hypothetical protein